MHKKVWTRNCEGLSGFFTTETLKCVEVHWPKSSACENAACGNVHVAMMKCDKDEASDDEDDDEGEE